MQKEAKNNTKKATGRQAKDASALNHNSALTFRTRKVTFTRLPYKLTQHLKLIYINVFINRIKVSRNFT